MEFAILGPVEARLNGKPVPLGGPKPRALLAMLLLEANSVVSRDRLIEGLWGERLPPTAGHTLDDYISRLRKALGADRIERRPPGYLVRVQPGELDLAHFDGLLEEGRAQLTRSDAAAAAETLRNALGLWRGPALADVLSEPFASVEADRLEEKHLSALEDRIEADLALGGGAELVAELEALAREHAFNERLLGQLMLALYRCGRQAEALELFRTARHRLADELGLEPGMQLRQLERQILAHDPALRAPRRPLQSLRVRRRSLLAAIAAVIVAGGVTIGVVLGLNRTDASQSPAVVRDALAVVDASSGRVEPGIDFTGSPASIAADRSSLWVADPDEGVVSRVNVSSGAIEDRIHVSGQPGEVAVGAGSVWVATTVGGTVSRIDPATGTVTQTIPLGGTPAAIAFGMNSVWVADPADDVLLRIEPRTGTVTSTLELSSRPSAVAVGLGGVWVASHDAGTVAHVDPASNKVLASVNVGQGPAAVATGAGSVWVANALDGTVSRLEPRTGRVVATIAVGSGPVALAFGGGAIWAVSEFSRTVSRIDPINNTVAQTLPVSSRRPAAAAAAGERVWIATRPSGDEHRGGTLTLLGFAPSSVDPGFNMQWYPPPSFLGLAYDTLVTFERTGGPAGLHLVPDLAVALPTATSGGRTYTFRLRPGIRYSNGAALMASDVRRGLERLFRIGSPAASIYTTIVGGERCARGGPESCDLSRGIDADDTTRTVVFHLAKPDPELLFKLALGYAVPVPAGTPARNNGLRPIPGTGPYRIARATRHETRFVRSRIFREWSHAAQPDGNPDVIVWRYGISATAQARAVRAGRADYMFQQIPTRLLADIRIHRPGQLRVNPVLGIEFLTINNRLPPFDRPAVRQALSYAIDRGEVVRLYGGPSVAEPTCQVLPPGIPGYRRYCPYTLHPRAGDGWAAPDLAQARRLVAASGTAGARVTVGVFIDESQFQKRLVRYVAGVVRSLGYRARVRLLSRADVSTERQRAIHLIPLTWYADYPAPANFLQILFTCRGGLSHGGFCDPAVDRLMRRASELGLTDARGAARAWADVDRRIVDAAASVPLVNPRAMDFVSSRVRNYQYHPVWGLLAGQVWLR